MTNNVPNATQLENDDREAIFQSHLVLVNKSILDELMISSCHINDLTNDVFPIGIQLIGIVKHIIVYCPFYLPTHRLCRLPVLCETL